MIELRELKVAEVSNNTLSLQQVSKIYPQFQIVTKGQYYPYDHVHKDAGWGCAWRAIQLLISSRDKHIAFDELFSKYARKQTLLKVIEQKLPALNTQEIRQWKWSPEQNNKNWAQPFIGQLICQSFNFKTKLILVNGYPPCYAPESVFDQTISFAQFRETIKKIIPNSPIMIDDGQLALSIIGYHQQADENFSIIFADPHIKSNCVHKNTGIYQVLLDKNGKQIEVIMSKQQKQCITESYLQMYFNEKKWMVVYMVDE